jgi:hypothetical protein
MDKVYWTTKNGEVIDVDDMDVNHLRNTLKMILRARNVKKEIDNIERRFLEEEIAEEQLRLEEMYL